MIPLADLELFYGKVKVAFWAFIWEEFFNFVEDMGVQADKYLLR